MKQGCPAKNTESETIMNRIEYGNLIKKEIATYFTDLVNYLEKYESYKSIYDRANDLGLRKDLTDDEKKIAKKHHLMLNILCEFKIEYGLGKFEKFCVNTISNRIKLFLGTVELLNDSMIFIENKPRNTDDMISFYKKIMGLERKEH